MIYNNTPGCSGHSFDGDFDISNYLDPNHLKEWIEGSGVDEELTRLNVESVSGEDIFYFLRPEIKHTNPGRPTDPEWKFYYQSEESSGWLFRPVDLDTGSEMEWGQFKADPGTPLARSKYLSPRGIPSQPFLMKVTEKIAKLVAKKSKLEAPKNYEFWQWLLEHPQVPLVITEGVKKAGCLLSLGLPCIGLVGVHNAYIEITVENDTKKVLHPTLAALCAKRKVYIIFDSDPRGKVAKNVRDAREKLAIAISQEKNGAEIFLGSVPGIPDEKVGLDDYIVSGGDVQLLFRRVVEFKDWMNPKRSKGLKAKILDMSETLNGRLKLNKLTNSVELDGKEVSWNLFRQNYALNIEDHPYGKDLFADIALSVADSNSYHPVRDYFNSLKPSDYNLDEVAIKYFGAEPGSLQCKMVRKWLISAVARVFIPGCKVDSALILYEPIGGVGKSTWFRKLCIDPTWFCDDMGSPEDKDQLLKMHQHWIIEWAELDCIIGFKNDSAIKSAISCAADNIRPPYGRSTEKMLRQSVLCGTTNKREFLFSKGGDRRYWVVECHGMIPNELLEKERDLIWGAAKAAYESGESWHLTRDEQRELSTALDAFRYKTPEQELIEEYLSTLEGKTKFLTKDMMWKLDISKSNAKFAKAARQVLEELGWERKTVRVKGQRGWGYEYLKNSVTGLDEKTSRDVTGEEQFCQGSHPSLSREVSRRHGRAALPVTPSNLEGEGNTGKCHGVTALTKECFKNEQKWENEVPDYTSKSPKSAVEGDFLEAVTPVTPVTPPKSASEMAHIPDGQEDIEDCKAAKEASPKFVVGDSVFINDIYLASHYGMTWGIIWKVHQDSETGYIEYDLQLDGKITQPIKEADLQLKKTNQKER